MTGRVTYISSAAIKWALNELAQIPNNQLALFFFLMLAKEPVVSHGQLGSPSPFEKELMRYLSGPVVGGGTAVYNPLAREWRAAEYINSTVFGRLLNGSHKWTEGEEAFFLKDPRSGWPARFTLSDQGFDNLRSRISPPCLKLSSRLPLTAVAVYYFRFRNLSDFTPTTLADLVTKYREEVLSSHKRLEELFVAGSNYLQGNLFSHERLSEEEMIACYPPSPFSSEPKKNALLYEDDINAINGKLVPGESVSDFVRKLLRKEGIWM